MIQWGGWLMILTDRVVTLDTPELSDYGRVLVYTFQLFAMLEFVHALLGIVKASPITTFVQVFGRLQVLLVHYAMAPASRQSVGNVYMILAWSSVEIVRYLYLALNVAGIAPFQLAWLRYSLFYVLYPIGVYGEMKVLYDSLPLLDSTQFLSINLPNDSNFSFSFGNYIRFFLIALYLPGLWSQYTYMIRQRRSVLEKLRLKTDSEKQD